jgi:hypothetical protein
LFIGLFTRKGAKVQRCLILSGLILSVLAALREFYQKTAILIEYFVVGWRQMVGKRAVVFLDYFLGRQRSHPTINVLGF